MLRDSWVKQWFAAHREFNVDGPDDVPELLVPRTILATIPPHDGGTFRVGTMYDQVPLCVFCTQFFDVAGAEKPGHAAKIKRPRQQQQQQQPTTSDAAAAVAAAAAPAAAIIPGPRRARLPPLRSAGSKARLEAREEAKAIIASLPSTSPLLHAEHIAVDSPPLEEDGLMLLSDDVVVATVARSRSQPLARVQPSRKQAHSRLSAYEIPPCSIEPRRRRREVLAATHARRADHELASESVASLARSVDAYESPDRCKAQRADRAHKVAMTHVAPRAAYTSPAMPRGVLQRAGPPPEFVSFGVAGRLFGPQLLMTAAARAAPH